MITNLEWEKVWNNEDYRRILNHVCEKFKNIPNLHDHDLESLQMEVLLKALNDFDDNKDTKFTTFLYWRMYYKLQDVYKKSVKELSRSINIDTVLNLHTNENTNFQTIMYDLEPEDRELIIDRVINQKTFKEMATERKVGLMKIKRKVSKAMQRTKRLLSINN